MRRLIKKISGPLFKKAYFFWLRKPRRYSYKDTSVVVAPGVFPPFLTFSTKLLLEFIEEFPLKGKTFLELGCGCGIISIAAAKKGAKVTATDINETALASLHKNAADNSVSIEIRKSDLFGDLRQRAFDIIVINPPYYPRNPNSIAENAWFCGENFEYFKELFSGLPDFLTLENSVYMVLSEDCEIEKIKSLATKHHLITELIIEKTSFAETNYIYKLSKV